MLKEKAEEKNYVLSDRECIESPESMSRRSVIRKLAVGTAVLAGSRVLPDKWTTPLVEFGALPAHATTSGDLTEMITSLEEGPPDAAGDAVPAADATAESTVVEVAEQAQVVAEVNEELHGYTRSLTLMNTGAKMSCDSIWQDKFVFSGLGPQYGPSFLLVWSDGRELRVPSSEHMVMNTDINDFRKYQPGGVYSGNNPDIPSMEVYAARGTHPDSVTLFY